MCLVSFMSLEYQLNKASAKFNKFILTYHGLKSYMGPLLEASDVLNT